jgi:hypothetical protein
MRRAVRAWAFACLLAVAGQGAAALRIKVDPAGLSTDEQAASAALVAAATARLPPAFGESFDGVRLAWRDDLPPSVHGRARGMRIALRRELLAQWMEAGSSGTADGAHAALVALLHELAHLHDRSPAGRLSRDPRLLDLAGWPVRPLRLGLRARRNDFRERSPDPYELASPAEFVAVNFEHFLLDPAYACRRPQLHAYFAARFAWSPPQASCPAELPFVTAGDDGEALRLLGMAPSRIHAVDYLLAEPDEHPMSRWGHSMLRLVVCAPGRPRGPDCRLDLDHHLVLSFRAFVGDVQVSSWRGLTGSYPSRLFVLPLQQVVDEYTEVELRGLQSIPLRLDDAEIAALLARAARVHWSYDGRYYFVGNNCAVETWKLLNDAVPRLSSAPLRSITPTGLLRRLVRGGIADAGVLDDADEAVRLGYRFESRGAHFQEMFDIADAELALPANDARGWMALDPALRAEAMTAGGLRASAALLLLEQAALRREEAAAREALKQRFLRGRRAEAELASAGETLRALLDNPVHAGRPAALLQGPGYGLPWEDERRALAQAVPGESGRLLHLQSQLRTQARRLLPPGQRERLERVEANLERIGRHLRSLDTAPP